MKKTLVLFSLIMGHTVLFSKSAFSHLAEENLSEKEDLMTTGTDLLNTYDTFKETLHNKYGFDYLIRASFLAQRGAPNGENTVFRDKYEIEANWNIFHSDWAGAGSIQFLYEDINYSKLTATQMAARLNIAEPMNDDANPREFFKRLTYTHQLPGAANTIALSFGQFLIGSFTQTKYDATPLYYFNNFALAKIATKSYPTGGVGAYVTFQPMDNLILRAGTQDTTNYFPQNISLKNINENKWTSFIWGTFSSNFIDIGKTVFTGWIYHSPKIPKYSGKFNRAYEKANGYNLSIRQNIGKKTVLFVKANAATGNRMPVKQSYAFEMLYLDPFNRNTLDQIGAGIALNKTSHLNKNVKRSVENVAEFYYAFGLSNKIVIQPDIEFYINPALTRETRLVTVTSLTLKLLL